MAGIAIGAFNAGFNDGKGLGINEYLGQDEILAGRAAGERLTQDGAKHVVCVIQQQGQGVHLRHQRRVGRRDLQRWCAVGDRSAAVPAGLPRGGFAVADQQRERDRGGGPTLTGRAFIDKSNIADVAKNPEAGAR